MAISDSFFVEKGRLELTNNQLVAAFFASSNEFCLIFLLHLSYIEVS